RETIKANEKEILKKAIPIYIYSYLGEKSADLEEPQKTRLRYFMQPPDLSNLALLIKIYQKEIMNTLHNIFLKSWPEEDQHAITEMFIKKVVEEFSDTLVSHAKKLFDRVSTYRKRIRELHQKSDTETLTIDEKNELRALSNGIDHYTKESQENYILTYLTKDGFFPGYALQREGVLAQCIDPFIEIGRPNAIAVRELTPSSLVYANKNVFKIGKINFRQIRESEGRTGYFEGMVYEKELDRLIDKKSLSVEGGELTRIGIESCPLIEVELYNQDEIDDRKMDRRRIGFNIYGVTLDDHHGGYDGEIKSKSFRYLINQKLRLVNLGPTRIFRENINAWGFPICPVCGAVRDPFQSDAEKEKFADDHQRLCGIQAVQQAAIHVEFRSETLRIGPYDSITEAINVMEGICIGAGEVLDMGESELGSFIFTDDNGRHWPIYFDPVPGGSGFIPQIMNYWQSVLEAANEKLVGCPQKCEKACYSCMMHFRNQQFHPQLNRFIAEQCLTDLLGNLKKKTDIPPKFIDHQTEAGESDPEDQFMQIIRNYSFPIPESQYQVNLTDGSYSVADFAYPDKKVLIYVDGMSKKIHGNPEQMKKDKLKRAKLKMMGYLVIEITAVSLNDKKVVDGFLSELAVYLEN
ncbi:MAG: Zn-binding domain-containing protein, partial [Candidatus Hodarchaeota archaeon]